MVWSEVSVTPGERESQLVTTEFSGFVTVLTGGTEGYPCVEEYPGRAAKETSETILGALIHLRGGCYQLPASD